MISVLQDKMHKSFRRRFRSITSRKSRKQPCRDSLFFRCIKIRPSRCARQVEDTGRRFDPGNSFFVKTGAGTVLKIRSDSVRNPSSSSRPKTASACTAARAACAGIFHIHTPDSPFPSGASSASVHIFRIPAPCSGFCEDYPDIL